MSQALIYGIGPDGKTAVAAKINAGGELVVTGGSGGGGGGGTSDTTEATQLAVLAALTAESAKLPASLGAKTAANSLSVAPASDSLFAFASTAARAVAAITRPANVTAYSANDVVGGVLTLAAAGPAAGHVVITSADLRYDVSAIPSGMSSFRLYLYRSTPPSALADNAAWDLPSGDRASFIGYVDLGTIADLGSTLFVQVDGINKQVKLGAAETALYGYLVTTAGYTPAANSETLQLTLRTVAL